MQNENRSQRDCEKEHIAWRRTVAAELPELSRRVFGLRGKAYSGHGLRYDLERKFGRIVVMASTLDNAPTLSERLIEPVIYDGFLEDLAAAEASAADLSQ